MIRIFIHGLESDNKGTKGTCPILVDTGKVYN
jgi:hypothetical protein